MGAAAFRIFVDGEPATQDQLDRFESISVDQALDKAWEGRFEVPVCLDEKGKWKGEDEEFMTAFSRLRVEIKVGSGGFVPLIDGPVVGHDTTRSAEPGKSAITLVVHDDSVHLNRDADTEAFEGKSDSEIAEALFASRAEIASTIVERTPRPPSDEPFEVTRRGTEMDLLRELGKRTDRKVGVLPGAEPDASVGVFHSIPIAGEDLPGAPEDLPALVLLGRERNIETFDLRFDGQRPRDVFAARLSLGDKTIIEQTAKYRDTSLVAEVPPLEEDQVGKEMLRPGVGGADLQQAVEAQRDRRSRAYHASGTIRAGCYAGVLSPYRSVTVRMGTTAASAAYVVKHVTHRLGRSEYTQEFGLISNATSRSEAAASLIPGGIF